MIYDVVQEVVWEGANTQPCQLSLLQPWWKRLSSTGSSSWVIFFQLDDNLFMLSLISPWLLVGWLFSHQSVFPFILWSPPSTTTCLIWWRGKCFIVVENIFILTKAGGTKENLSVILKIVIKHWPNAYCRMELYWIERILLYPFPDKWFSSSPVSDGVLHQEDLHHQVHHLPQHHF